LTEDQFKHYTSYYKLPTELFAKDKSSGQYIPRRTPEQQLAFNELQAKLKLPELRKSLLADIGNPTWANVPPGEKVSRAIEANVDLMQIPGAISEQEMMAIPQYKFDIMKALSGKSAQSPSGAVLDSLLPSLDVARNRLTTAQKNFDDIRKSGLTPNTPNYKIFKAELEQAQMAYSNLEAQRRQLAGRLSGLYGDAANWGMVENKQ
jgi:hypothetical protein